MTSYSDLDDTSFKAGFGVYRQVNTGLFARIVEAWKDMPA